MRVRAYTYTSTTPQTRDKYKTKGDHKAENAQPEIMGDFAHEYS